MKGTTFYDLHMAIQIACGWTNEHLFEFATCGRRRVALARLPFEGDWEPAPSALEVPVEAFFGNAGERRCSYLYDFGDAWYHNVALRGVVDLRERFRSRLLGGARAFPPDDCGGLGGYLSILEFLRTGKDPQGRKAEELREWIGDWDPEHFDLDALKGRFDQPSRRRRGLQK